MTYKEHFKILNIENWQQKTHSEDHLQEPSLNVIESPANENLCKLQKLQNEANHCTSCALHKTRKQVVFGVGNPDASLMIIGEAPGFYEDQQGEPFVGRAGQLLNFMLQAIGFKREQIYIANILKCRPPNNRDPALQEVESCTPFLNKQIYLIQPKLILSVGRISAHFLLKTKNSLESLRHKVYQYNRDIPLIVTYHPAYLLRNPIDKKKAFLDFHFVKNKLEELCK